MTEPKITARRKPWLAGLLSGSQPGLGQLYNGEVKKAVFLAVVASFIMPPVCASLVVYAPLHPPYNLLLRILLCISVYIAILREATRMARFLGDSYALKPFNKWYVYIGVVVLGAFVAQPAVADLIRLHIVQAFKMPAGSMMPTLLPGDHVLVDKVIYTTGKTPQRGDIIVFKYPEDETKEFIKRVIALPGETIQIRNKIAYVNDAALNDESYTQRVDPGVLKADTNPRDNFGPVTVPEKSYFVMGDNRDQSLDSRFFGYVRLSKVVGKILFVYWSWDDKSGYVRWDRIGKRFE